MASTPDYTLPRLTAEEGSVTLSVHVVPGASRDRVVGVHGDALKVAVTAPPEKGKANACVADLLAKELGLSRSQVLLERGKTSRRKRFRLARLTLADAQQRLRKIDALKGTS